MKIDLRSVVRFTVIVIAVLYLLDAGVEASKTRKHGNRHRSKRTHGDKPRRRNKEKAESEGRVTEPNSRQTAILVEKQRKRRPVQKMPKNRKTLHQNRENFMNKDGFLPYVYEQVLREKEERLKKQQQDNTTLLPVVEAKLQFYIIQPVSEGIYLPPTTTASTIYGYAPSELGLLPFHRTNGKYGLHTSAKKISGKIVHILDAGRANSHFGCGEAIANFHEIPKNNDAWIALIERGHCAFFRKIKLAEKHNASAVIFYDNKDGDVPRINTIGTRIVSVIMGKHDGHRVAKVADRSSNVMAHISISTEPTPDPSMLANVQRVVDTTEHGAAMTHHKASITTWMLFMLTATFYYLSVTS